MHTKPFAIFLIAVLLVVNSEAQKKVVPVTQSSLTGITLPNGSKRDSRMLSELSAKALLQAATKKVNSTVKAVEILSLPVADAAGTDPDSLISQFSSLGWKIIPVESDDKFVWLQKDNRYIITYFSMNKNSSELYFGEVGVAPVFSQNGSSTQVSQTADKQQPNALPAAQTVNNTNAVDVNTKAVSNKNRFAFTTTNFDDGWTSTVQEDWVEVTKGNIRVLIHYPNKNADVYNSVLLDGLKNAWNVLVAPRYSTATNFEFKPISGWQSIEFAEAGCIENTTGKSVHVVLFKMNYSNGSGKYLEFITTDKQSFEKEFGAYHQTTSGWENMENMANYNKFAVAASDLAGKWTSNFTGMTQYVFANTGASAGADTHASNENFEFVEGNNYKWDLGVASGFVGNIKFQSVKSTGKFSLPNNWQINFSDIEGKPKTYNVHFTCIKGTRVLWIGDTGFGKKE
jgi:hypothetical protein